MSLTSILTWLSAEDKKVETAIEAAFAKAAPVLEEIFADAAKVEPYIAILYPKLATIPGIQPALAAMPSLIQTAQAAAGPGTTGPQKLTAVLSLMQGVSTQAQTVLTGGAKAWTADETAAVTQVVNNAVTYMNAAGAAITAITPPAAPATASVQAGVDNH